MKNHIISAIALVMLITAASCKKCRICECKKNGALVAEQKNCDYGGGSSNSTLDKWEQMLKEDPDFDEVNCRDGK